MAKGKKFFAVILMMTLSVFFAITYYRTFVITEAEDEGVRTVLTAEQPSVVEQTEIASEPEKIVAPVFRTTLPRAASSLGDGKINNVGGYGKEELVSSYKLGAHYYAIIESNSDNCDLSCSANNIAIAKFDSGLTLIEVLSLRTLRSEHFLASSLYDEGLMVVASSYEGTSVYTITTDMKVARLSLNVASERGIAYYTSSGVTVVLFGSNYICVYMINSSLQIVGETSFSNQGCTDPVAIYKSGDFFLVANGSSFAKAFRFTFEGVKSIESLPYVHDVLPYKNGYVLLSCGETNTRLTTYDHEFKNAVEYLLPAASYAKIFPTENGYFLLTYGANKQTASYYLCKHFDVVSINGVDYEGADSAGAFYYDNGNIVFFTQNRNGINVYSYDCNAHRAEKISSISGAKGCEIYASEKVTLFTSDVCIGEYSDNFGQSDVFIRSFNW